MIDEDFISSTSKDIKFMVSHHYRHNINSSAFSKNGTTSVAGSAGKLSEQTATPSPSKKMTNRKG